MLDFNRRLSIAPMMDYTDRHMRYLMRLLSKHTLLYTEMITAQAIVKGDRHHLLDYDAAEHPLALQVGGSDPEFLAQSARIAEDWGYDEINLNVGCPSDRVQNGAFGACLMAKPGLVADCFKAMQDQVSIPVTIKCRIGIDDQDSYEDLTGFVEPLVNAGCKTFIIHARKAILQGLSPKENREIPPLNYPRVYQLKQDYPQLHISINGGIQSIEDSLQHLQHVDGVMIGRAAYNDPYLFSSVDQQIFGSDSAPPTRDEVVSGFRDYCEIQWRQGVKLGGMMRHLLGLYHGCAGARQFRRVLSETMHHSDATPDLLDEALAAVQKT